MNILFNSSTHVSVESWNNSRNIKMYSNSSSDIRQPMEKKLKITLNLMYLYSGLFYVMKTITKSFGVTLKGG